MGTRRVPAAARWVGPPASMDGSPRSVCSQECAHAPSESKGKRSPHAKRKAGRPKGKAKGKPKGKAGPKKSKVGKAKAKGRAKAKGSLPMATDDDNVSVKSLDTAGVADPSQQPQVSALSLPVGGKGKAKAKCKAKAKVKSGLECTPGAGGKASTKKARPETKGQACPASSAKVDTKVDVKEKQSTGQDLASCKGTAPNAVLELAQEALEVVQPMPPMLERPWGPTMMDGQTTPVAILEIFAGCARFSAACAELGMLIAPPIEKNRSALFDISVPAVAQCILSWLQCGLIWYVHLGTPCTMFSRARTTGKKKPDYAPLVFTKQVLELCVTKRLYFSLENPAHSKLFALPGLVSLFEQLGAVDVFF